MKIGDATFKIRREGDAVVVSVRAPYTAEQSCDLKGNEARAAFIKWVLSTAGSLLFEPGSQNDLALRAAAETYADACVDDEDAEFGGLLS